MNINSVSNLLQPYEGGILLVLLLLMVYLIVNQTLQFRALNGRMDRHDKQCQKFMDYMKDHEGRISHVEGRLDERQQPPT